MHIYTLENWQHSHDFTVDHNKAETSTKIVMLLTAIAMVAEIVAGTVFGSMALLADGWHMATHVAAFGITVFAYQYARNHAQNPKYTFGTGKVSVLGGFASAVALAVVALMMGIESIGRLFHPENIQFNEAIAVAVLGLGINVVSAFLLHDHDHDHGHDHDHHHGHSHHDHDDHHDQDHEHHHDDKHHHHHRDRNLQAAYIHVLADALTSVLAIVGLFIGKYLGWVWMDAVMGLVGTAVIAKWAYGLVGDTSSILLDGATDKNLKSNIIHAIEADADNRVVDLHIWYISQNHVAATIALVTHFPRSPQDYKQLLAHIPSLSHVIIEVNPCHGESCVIKQEAVGRKEAVGSGQ